MPLPLMTSVQPEAPDKLLEALRGVAIMDEHCVLMGTMIEKFQSAKSESTEACTSLLTGFEVTIVEKISQCGQYPLMIFSVSGKEKPNKGSK